MKSYLIFLLRNKFYTAVQAVGLAVSLAFVIIIGSYAWEQYRVANENPDAEHIYVLGMPDYYGLTYGFKQSVADRIPEIETISQIVVGESELIFDIQDERVSALVMAADREFFDLFPYYEMREGSADALLSNSSVLVSETFAEAHGLHTGDVLTHGQPYTVGGIVADFDKTLIKYTDVIVPPMSELDVDYDYESLFDHFGNCIPIVRLRNDADFDAFMQKAEDVCKEIYPTIYGNAFFEYLTATRLDKVFFHPINNLSKQFNAGDWDTLKVLIIVGILLFLSAVFNYINLNTALTGRRAKEMATRRLLGATKGEIIARYILEALLFTALCFAAALLLAVAFAPVMDRLLNNPYITVRVLFTPATVAGFAAVVLTVGTLVGFISALPASRFKPIDVMKGSFRMTSRMTFSRYFIVLQNALSVFLIAMALVMEAQHLKSLSRPMHIDTENIFYLTGTGGLEDKQRQSLSDAFRALPCVTAVGRTQGAPGFSSSGQYSRTRDGDEIIYRTFKMDSIAFAMFHFEKVRDYGTPPYGAIWFGERAFLASGFDDDYHDISVLKERMLNVEYAAGTITEFPLNPSNMGEEGHLLVQLLSNRQMDDMFWHSWILQTTGDKDEARRQIMQVYEKWCNDLWGRYMEPMSADFVDDNYRKGLQPAYNNMRLLEVFMLLSIVVSMLGLIAMSTYYAAENAKSIAIRKVFGGTVASETVKSVRTYMVLVAVAGFIGIPAAVWAAERYLQSYIYRLESYRWLFFAALALSAAAAFLSVLWQVLRAAHTNPATELKKE